MKKRLIVLALRNSAQLLFFRNLHFLKFYAQTNFEIDKCVFILKRMRLTDN